MRRVYACFGLVVVSLVLCCSCSDDNPAQPNQAVVPVISTEDVCLFTQTTAVCGGAITSDGGATISARGVCWGLNANPTTADNKTTDGSGTGNFASSMTGLTPGTPYFVRAYATNSAGTGYGSAQSFTTAASSGTVTDIDGNVYPTVTIGTQVWMAENLKVTHYRNGDDIPNVTNNTSWKNLASGAYCEYNNDSNNVATYGRLYNWYAIGDSRNIAPAGWHVPSDAEWQTLVDYLGGESVAGGKMKVTCTTLWAGTNDGATNESGFSAFPAGHRNWDGAWLNITTDAYFWTSSEETTLKGWYLRLVNNAAGVGLDNYSKLDGFSIRCVQD